jgi:hypothetical protein
MEIAVFVNERMIGKIVRMVKDFSGAESLPGEGSP